MLNSKIAGAIGKLAGVYPSEPAASAPEAVPKAPKVDELSTQNIMFEKFVGWAWRANQVATAGERVASYIVCAVLAMIENTVLHRIDAVREFANLNTPQLAAQWVAQLKKLSLIHI